MTGAPWPTNPFIDADEPPTSATSTPTATATCRASPSARDGTLWSVEHGTHRDDEVNRLGAGRDYGWHPVPGYNEGVPMTDHSLPGKPVQRRDGAPATRRWPRPARPG